MLHLGVAEDTSSEQTRSKAKVFEPGQCVRENRGGGGGGGSRTSSCALRTDNIMLSDIV